MDPNNTVIVIEFGSTRIKAVMLDDKHNTIASGDFSWENRLENRVWTYHYN
jgi:sugar (pentulose or hexulose) kinase